MRQTQGWITKRTSVNVNQTQWHHLSHNKLQKPNNIYSQVSTHSSIHWAKSSLILHLAAWQSFTQGMLKNKTAKKNIQLHHVMRNAVHTDTYLLSWCYKYGLCFK